ncbi:UNVERIFIED_CONTAM: hypothetical protein K2H54_048722 [Gekko kuhli]
MEFVDHSQPACSRPVPNGYTNKIFQAHPKERSADLNSGGCDNNEQEDAARHKKKTKGSRIWNLVSRKKGTSLNTKRPRSMILFGDNMEGLEQNHKMSFMDRVRSFKKLRSSGASKNTSKTKPAAVSEEVQEDVEQKARHRIKKLSESQRPFRHSYAGYIEDLDSSFEDVELNSCVLDMDTSESKWQRIVDTGINGEDPSSDCHKNSTLRSVASEFEHSERSESAPGDTQRRHTVAVPENRKGRSSDVWSYLKGISLTSKDNSKPRDERIEPSFPELDNTTDNSSSYLDFDLRCEEEVEAGQPKRPNHPVKGTHFGGVRRFFSSVAEAARKWRASSKTLSQEEQRPNSGCGHQRQEVSSHQQPLLAANDNGRVFSSTGMCPDSGIGDKRSSKSAAKEKLPPGNANAEISQEVSGSVLSRENGSFNETSFLPHGSSLSAFPFSEFPDDSCAFLGVHGLAMDLLPIDDPLLHQVDHRGVGTASRETWVLDSWVRSNSDSLDGTSRDAQGLAAPCLKGQDFTKAKLDATDMEGAPLDYKNWCDAESGLSLKTDRSTLGPSAAAEYTRPLASTMGDAEHSASLVAEIRTHHPALVDNEYVDGFSQGSPDMEFTPVDNPHLGRMLADNQISENSSSDSQHLLDSQDLANTLTDTCEPESSPPGSQNISPAPSDTQSMGSIPEDMYSSYIPAPLSCPTQALDRENSPMEVNGKTFPSRQSPKRKPHFKYREVCHPFQMSLCTVVSFNEFNSGKMFFVFSDVLIKHCQKKKTLQYYFMYD